jgi:hypothetical protein
MTRPFNFLFAALILPLFFIQAQAQETETLLGNWYLQERFLIADKNEDALMEKSELEKFSKEFGYFLYGRNYILTDLNRDGKLSFNEMSQRVESEFSFRQQMDRKEIRELKSNFSELENPNLTFLKNNPELVSKLFTNLEWMYTHPQLVTELSQDASWSQDHPEALLSLQRNLCWLATNPEAAKTLYKNREATRQLPELLSWRADHKSFMKNYPFLNGNYMPAFWPGNIRMRGK